MKSLALIVQLCLVVGGCAMGPAAGSIDRVSVEGALFLDLHVDSPCATADAPPELAGVTLTFTGPEGESLGEAVTGPIGHEPLEFGEGKEGWQYPGCRFVSLYSASLSRADSYTVSFRAAARPGQDAGVGFTGIDELGEQTIAYEELEANAFAWDFEVAPSYVVGH